MYRNKALILMLLLLFAINLACGTTNSEQIQNLSQEATTVSAQPSPTTVALVEAQPTTAGEAATVAVQATSTPAPTRTPAPTATPEPVIQPLVITGTVTTVQSGRSLAVIFFVENPNPGHAIESARYQVDVYDAAGTMIESDWSYLSIVLPGQTMGVVAETYLEENQQAERSEVLLSEGDANLLEFSGELFAIEQATFIPNQYSPKITGIIKNSLSRDVTELRVNAIAYNAEGEVVGGGYTYVNFIPASGQTGVEISCEVNGNPARVEIYPTLSGLSVFEDDDSEIAKLALVKQGHVLDDNYLSVSFLVKNVNQEMAIDTSQYQVIAYDEAGGVLSTDEGYIEVVFPNEFAAGFSQLSLPAGKKLGNVVVQLNAGETVVGDLEKTPFVVEQTHFWPGRFGAEFTAQITNPLGLTFTTLKTVMVAYDAEDNIIGGGFTYLNFVPANGKAGVSMSAKVSATPARLEFYPMLSSISSVDTEEESPLVLKAQGHVVDNLSGVAFLVENTDANMGISFSEYQVLIYASDGVLISTAEGYLPLLLPGQTGAEYTLFSLPAGTKLDRVEIQLHAGSMEVATVKEFPLSVSDVTYQPGGYTPKVTGIVKSSLKKELTFLSVVAIAYDAEGNIIGGGTGYVDKLAPNGEAAVEISLNLTGQPDRIELYPGLSGWSDLE